MRIVALTSSHLDYLQIALVCRELRRCGEVSLIYPGRLQDFHITQAFIGQLDLPEPDVKLDIALNEYQSALGALVNRLEKIMAERRPDLVLIGGRTNVAMAGALVAARLHIPLVRLEAGQRSFDKHAVGEVSQLVGDRLADRLFCETQSAVEHLAREGIFTGVYLSGAVQADVLRRYLPVALQRSTILSRIGLPPYVYILALIEHLHLVSGTGQLHSVLGALNAIREPIVLPSFENTRTALDSRGLSLAAHVLPVDLTGYIDWLALASNARVIVTDSDDVQREAYLLGVPCITVSDLTVLPETVALGWNELAGTQPDRIIAAVRDFMPPSARPPVFGDGYAVERIGTALATETIEFGHSYNRVVETLERQPLAI